MDLGRKIKFYRNKKRLTQAELAELAHVSSGFIGQIETSKAYPSIPTLRLIAKALGVSPSSLLENEDIIMHNARTVDLDNLQNLQLKHNSRLLSEIEKEKIQGIIKNAMELKKEGEPHISVIPNNPDLNEEKLLKTVERVVQSVLDKKKGKQEKTKNPSLPWYIDEIKKGRSLHEQPDLLCRLLSENIIKPTIYGDPLTQDQKEGLIKFIRSHKDLLSNKKDDSTLPEDYAAHYKGEEVLDLNKEPELVALMKAADIINKMLQKYLEEEEVE